MNQEYDTELWEDVVKTGKKLERGITHKLSNPFIDTIISTLEYYGATSSQLEQVQVDLLIAKYKIWDWLGMCLSGRLDTRPGDSVYKCIKKMCQLYVIQNNVGGWAWWLRGHDLDIEFPSRCEDCIKSYQCWLDEVSSDIQKN